MSISNVKIVDKEIKKQEKIDKLEKERCKVARRLEKLDQKLMDLRPKLPFRTS